MGSNRWKRRHAAVACGCLLPTTTWVFWRSMAPLNLSSRRGVSLIGAMLSHTECCRCLVSRGSRPDCLFRCLRTPDTSSSHHPSLRVAVVAFLRRAERSWDSKVRVANVRNGHRTHARIRCQRSDTPEIGTLPTFIDEGYVSTGKFATLPTLNEAEKNGRSPEGSESLTGPCTLLETLQGTVPPMPPNAADVVMRTRHVEWP
jgi:hypothetical protein